MVQIGPEARDFPYWTQEVVLWPELEISSSRENTVLDMYSREMKNTVLDGVPVSPHGVRGVLEVLLGKTNFK
jgi:hypothetical protein